MRARAGDPPRTMPQKILAGRATDPQLRGDVVHVKVDQVVLSRAPSRALAEALAAGMKKTSVEVAVAYDGTCITDAASLADVDEGGPTRSPPSSPTLQRPHRAARDRVPRPGPPRALRGARAARAHRRSSPRHRGRHRHALARRPASSSCVSVIGWLSLLQRDIHPSQISDPLLPCHVVSNALQSASSNCH